MRRLRVSGVQRGAEDLAELLRDLGGHVLLVPAAARLPTPIPPTPFPRVGKGEIEASFDDHDPQGLEDRVEMFLHLIDPTGAAILQSAKDDGPWLPGWRAIYFGTDVGRFRIRPPWLPERGAILLDPRGAFGSGQHPSTQLALKLLDQIVDRFAGKTMLDVGAGSGILSVAAARCGLKVSAIELEPEARKACLRTAALNEVQLELIDSLEGRYDLIAANLPGSTLLELLPALRKLAPVVIASGSRDDSGEWTAAILQ
jgi:ribosomal protein L11 methyltransferase